MSIISNINTEKMYISLRQLIDLKSARDKEKFTIYKLAKALKMPHSILVKLLHSDPAKRVRNPRIDTLSKIINFFNEDGFNITIDDLLTGNIISNSTELRSQELAETEYEHTLSLYSMNGNLPKKESKLIKILLPYKSNSLIAMISTYDIKPIFKKGSIFIIDTERQLENENLIALKTSENNEVKIRKINLQSNKKILLSYEGDNHTEFFSEKKHNLIGVVVKIDAKT